MGRLFAGASEASALPAATRIRRTLAVLLGVYTAVLIVSTVSRGDVPGSASVLVGFGAIALYANRGGGFVRDWLPVFVGSLAYVAAGSFASQLKFGVHYLPQLDADRVIGFGTLPTVWLQHHLYGGRTGWLEVACAVAYLSHFFVPVIFGFWLWMSRRRDAFIGLMYGLLTVCVLGEITFVLAPTAPPWMAAEHGLAPPIHHLFKQTLYDLHFSKAAAFIGDPKKYDAVAAMPSLHAAWPIISLLVARRYGLPRWVRWTFVTQLAAIVFTIVYTGEHYVSDAIVGVAYALVAFWAVQHVLGRQAAGRPVRALVGRAAGGGQSVPGSVAASQDGQALVEYVFIVSLVSIVSVGALRLVGVNVIDLLNQAVNMFP
jgi:hypothetical protein